MKEFVTKHEFEDEISICFSIEEDEVMDIGKKIQAINDQAYMNGYNWEAFLNHYLQTNQPGLLVGLDTDSEAGTYVALYYQTDSEKADKLVDVINGLVMNPDRIYSYL